MNAIYYEGIVLTTINNLLKEGGDCGQLNLVKQAKLSNVAIIAATKRLEAKGRLRVIRGLPGQRYHYEILDPPNEFDLMALEVHLASRNSKENKNE
jgi:hypothetical protein